MAKTTLIKASSRVSVKINESYYTVEYTEERSVNTSDNLKEARAALWETVNSEVDGQVEDIIQLSKK